MDLNVATIVSLVLAAISIFASVFYLKAKGKVTQSYLLGKEALDVVKTVVDALEDDTVTDEEIAALKKEAADVKAAFLALIGKS